MSSLSKALMDDTLDRISERIINISLYELPYSIRSYCRNVGKRWTISALEALQARAYSERLLTRSALIKRARVERKYWEYGSQSDIKINSKIDDPPEFRAIAGDYGVVHDFVVRMDDCLIMTKYGVIFTQKDEIILESTGADAYLLNYCVFKELLDWNFSNVTSLFSARPKMPVSETNELILPLCGIFSSNYYHWILQHLPKIQAAEFYHRTTGYSPVILLESDPPQWQLDSLEVIASKFGIREWDGSPIRAPTLVPVHHQTAPESFEPSILAYQWLRENVLSALAEIGEDTPNRIYVSRNDANTRRVKNEGELMDMLEKYDFVRILASEHSFSEQVALFANANIVIGPHGAAFANLIFSEDISIVELMHSDDIRSYFYALSQLLEFEYDWVECKRYRDDLVVSVSRVENRLISLL